MDHKRQTLSRPLASRLREQSGCVAPGTASPALIARINEKRQELENLKKLQALSADLASQIETLAESLCTLTDGTDVVATVLSNWQNVLRAINIASTKLPKPADSEERNPTGGANEGVHLPQTLVRIPTQHAATLLEQSSAER